MSQTGNLYQSHQRTVIQMNEYINKEKAIAKFIEGDGDNDFTEGYNFAVGEYKEKIKAMKSEDVQPVKRGEWEELTDYGGWGDTHYRCSVCGEEWYLEDGKPKDNNMNFCPRCGARMDGEQNDNSET